MAGVATVTDADRRTSALLGDLVAAAYTSTPVMPTAAAMAAAVRRLSWLLGLFRARPSNVRSITSPPTRAHSHTGLGHLSRPTAAATSRTPTTAVAAP